MLKGVHPLSMTGLSWRVLAYFSANVMELCQMSRGASVPSLRWCIIL